MLKNIWNAQWIILLLFLVFLPAQPSEARLRGVHAAAACGDCHGQGFAVGLFSQTPTCLTCHDGLPNPTKKIANADASQLFNYTGGVTLGTSHAWGVTYTESGAGASSPRTTGQTQYGPGNLGCSSCHYPHYYLNNLTSQPLLKRDNSEDQLCLDCHKARNVDSASTPQPGRQRSHPVGVPVPATTAFNDPSINIYGVAGSDLRLLGAGNNVSCSTCHGVHFADSNPWTDATSANLSSVPNGKGVLLRRYNDSQLCKDCHNYMGHSATAQMDCRNCHDPHLGTDTNLRLINSLINTPRYGNRTTVLDNLSVGFAWRSDGKIGICEACHTINVALQPYSTPFPNWSSKHASANVNKSEGGSTDCLFCHNHKEGVGYDSFLPAGAAACSGCHGFPPSSNTFGGPSGFANYSTGALGFYNYTADASGGWKDESQTPHKRHALDYPFDQGGGEPGPTGSCYACHATASHQNKEFQNVVFGLYSKSTGVWGDFDDDSGGNTRTCTDVYCHSDGGPNDVVGPPQTPVDWNMGPGTLSDCNDCHLNPPITNRHTKHAEGNYNYGCINCHTNTVSDNTTIANEKAGIHVNRVKNVDFGSIAATSGLQIYSTTSNTCKNVWCHGEFPNGNNTNDPDWDLAGTQNCGACHDLPPTASGAHLKHANDATYDFDCAYCHGEKSEMAFGDDVNINNYTSHVNGVKNVKFQNDGLRDIASGTFDSGTKKCADVYCHSDGTATASPFFVNETAMWTATFSCKKCHGNNLNDGDYKRATPLYPNTSPKENSHDKHVIDNGLGCQDCHNETVNADNISIKNYTAHVNGNYNIDIASAFDSNGGTSNYNLGSKQCSGIKCHGSGTPTWGTDNGSITCESCHGSGADLDDFVFQSFSGTAALIDSADYTNTGHGKATGNYPETGLPAADRACLDCHDENVSHGDGTNPFRLMTSDPNQFCLGCHGDAGDRAASWNFAGMSSIDMQSHTHANISSNGYVAPDLSDNWRMTPKCVDCHDPHGDSNLAMIHDKVATKGSNVFGIPSSTYFNASTVVFTGFSEDVAGTFSYNTPDLTSICRACHSNTRFHQQFNNASGSHNNDQTCIGCHKHETGFTPAGCDGGCHGYPPSDPTMLVYSSGTDTPGLGGTGSTTEGAHEEHVSTQSINCQLCHSGGMQPGTSENNNITLEFNAYGSYTTGIYDGQQGVIDNATFSYDGAASVGMAGPYDLSCNNVKCHGASLPNGNGADTTPVWNDPATGDCGNCHGVKKNPGDATYPTSNAHKKHVDETTYQLMCKTCHSATVLGTSTTLNVSNHVNAEATIELYTSDNKIQTNWAYNGDPVIGTGYGDCTNTYCHSLGNYTAVDSFTAAKNPLSWQNPRTCNSCHGNNTYVGDYKKAMPNYADASPKFNRHSTHVIANSIECVVCHTLTLATNTSIADYGKHVDKTYNVDIMTEYDNDGGAGYGYDQATDTCSNIDCHGENDVAWSDTGIQCQNCHFDGTSDDDNWTFGNFSTAVAKIYSSEWAAEGHGKAGISKLCTACHDTDVAHGPQTGADYFRLYTSDSDGLCLGCHGAGGELGRLWTDAGTTNLGIQTHSWANISTAGYTGLANISGNVAPWSFTPKCVDCHDPHGDTNVKMIQSDLNISGSDVRGIPLGNTSTVNFTGAVNWNTFVNASYSGICQRCHDSAVANFDKGSFSATHNPGSKCTQCHKHDQGFKPSACDGCHGTPPSDYNNLVGGSTNPGETTSGSATAGAHVTHVTDKGFSCLNCHAGGMDPSGFSNVSIDIGFDYLNYTTGQYLGHTNMTGYEYNGDVGVADDSMECSNVKCHGSALANGRGLDTTPQWDQPATAECGDCHGAKKVAGGFVGGGPGPDTNAHQTHTDIATYDLMCQDCHDATLDNDTTLANSDHVNERSKVLLDFTNNDRIDGDGAYANDLIDSTYEDCTNTYCHSMGNYTTSGSYSVPNQLLSWENTRACNSCHGNDIYVGDYKKAMPNYDDASPKFNRHSTHVVANSIECVVCHTLTLATNTSIADFGKHVDKTYDVDIMSQYNNIGVAFNYDQATDTCTNTDCHGENTIAWSDTGIQCQNCHFDGTSDDDNWTFGNFSTAVAKIYSTDWAAEGHGKAGIAKACTACHDSTVSHGTESGADYFRLYTSDSDGLCLGCHGAGGELGRGWTDAGTTKLGIQTHSWANISTAGYTGLANISGNVAPWSFTPKCVDCHDPHGDTNVQMIQSDLNISGSDSRGIPLGNTSTVNFTGAVNWNTFVNASYSGICQRCHDSAVANFDKNSFAAGHNPGSKCTQCHKHSQGFKPTACDGCHGTPPSDYNSLVGGSTNPGETTSGSSTAGAHVTHVADKGFSCLNCHAGGMDPSGFSNVSIDIGFDYLNYTTGQYLGHTNMTGYEYNGDVGVADDSMECSNVKCHGSALINGRGLDTTPQWDQPATAECGDCHGAKKVAGSVVGGAGPDTGAHEKHAAVATYDFMCKTCHSATVLTTSTTLSNAVHVNEESKVELDITDNRITDAGGYTDVTLGSGYMNCDNTYCHSMGNVTTSGGFTAPNDPDLTWEEKRACNDCHGNDVYVADYKKAMPNYVDASPKFNRHSTHVIANSIECVVCHTVTLATNSTIANYSTHVNKAYDVDIMAEYDNVDAPDFSYNQATDTCSNADCHGENTVAWSDTGLVCQNCHLASAGQEDSWTFANFSGAVAQIITSEWASRGHGLNAGAKFDISSSVGPGLGCDNCHDSGIAHGTSNDYFRLWTSNPDTLCLGCHGSAGRSELGKSWSGAMGNVTGIQSHTYYNMSTAGYVPLDNLSGVAAWSFTPKCIDCHDPHGDTNNYMIHSMVNYTGSNAEGAPTSGVTGSVTFSGVVTWDSYVNASNNGLCQGCHNSTVANFDKASFSASHNPGQRCTDCHKHGEGFKPSGCNVCHGNGGDPSGAPPEAPIGKGWASDPNGGAHTAHVTAELLECKACHSGTGNGQSGTHGTGNPGKNNADLSNLTSLHGDWDGGALDGYQAGGTVDDRCSNIDCHGGRAYKRLWDLPTDCDDCHGNRNALSNYSAIRTGSHVMHTYSGADNSAGYNFVCTQCHVNNAAVDHYDSVVDLDFSAGQATLTNYSSRGGATFTFETFTTTENSGTCQEAYCHGGEMGAGSKGNEKPQWGNTATAQCGDCHITSIAVYGDNEDISQGAHTMHVTTYGFSCSRCHASETERTHVNGEVTFNDDTNLAGTGVCLPCHGDGVAAAKTGWPGGVTQGCANCHNTAGADVDNFVYTNITGTGMIAAKINMNQYSTVGHGRNSGQYTPGNSNNGANQGCTGCHDNTVDHGDGTNPFRLYSSDSIQLCNICHGVNGTATKVDITHHATSTTDARWDFDIKCVDCHDPHGDNNIFMIHSTIAAPNPGLHGYTSSDAFGQPYSDLALWNVDFTNNGIGDFSDSSLTDGHAEICNVCHIRTDQGSGSRYQRDMASESEDTHNSDKLCPSCHKHDKGFEGAGESMGGNDCGGCHSGLFDPMTSQNSYHHAMSNTSAVYPSITSLTTGDSNRRCLMCHVDHDIFSPAAGGNGRALNLRRQPDSSGSMVGKNINTDFYPQNPKYNDGSEVDPGDYKGLCIGCHNKELPKNTANRGTGDGSTKARGFTAFLYYSSSHNFQIRSSFNDFSDGTSFRANCSKCHSSYLMDQTAGAQGREEFGLHDTKFQSLNRAMNGTTSLPSPLGVNLCFNCHSNTYQKSFDIYSTAPMSEGAKLIKDAVTAKTYGHPMETNTNAHDPSEYYNATDGWNIGASRHVTCVDCHNTHGGNANVKRLVGTGTGNSIAGAQKGVWGVDVTSFPGTAGDPPSYTKIPEITEQWQLCAKCHTTFAWDVSTPPAIPSGGSGDPTDIYLTDVMREFNPSNYGFHPVVSVGRNQPPVNPAGNNWPGSSTVGYINTFTGYSGRQTTTVEGLAWTMIPPWNQNSTMGCTDCHTSDSKGLAAAGFAAWNTSVAGSWANVGDGIMERADGTDFATSSGTVASKSDLTGPDISSETITDILISVVTRQTGGKNKILTIQPVLSGSPLGLATAFTMSQSAAFTRYEVSVWADFNGTCDTSACLENNMELEITDTSDVGFDVDYVALTAYYLFPKPLRGPHGSLQKWLLASAKKDMKVDWNNDTDYGDASEQPNSSIASDVEERVFCWNCHRRDVYGLVDDAPANENYSRHNHTLVSTNGGPVDSATAADYLIGRGGSSGAAIWCLFCHGGRSAGQIHGQWAVTDAVAFPDLGEKGGRPIGVRLQNGATASLSALLSSGGDLKCYTLNSADDVGDCSSHSSGTVEGNATAYNYDYETYP